MAETQIHRSSAIHISGIATVLPLLTGVPLALVATLFFELSSAEPAVAGFCIGAIVTSIVIAEENRTKWAFAPARHALSLILAAIITAIWVACILAGMFVLGAILYPPNVVHVVPY